MAIWLSFGLALCAPVPETAVPKRVRCLGIACRAPDAEGGFAVRAEPTDRHPGSGSASGPALAWPCAISAQ